MSCKRTFTLHVEGEVTLKARNLDEAIDTIGNVFSCAYEVKEVSLHYVLKQSDQPATQDDGA